MVEAGRHHVIKAYIRTIRLTSGLAVQEGGGLSMIHGNGEYAYIYILYTHTKNTIRNTEVPHTQDKHTQLSSFTWLHCSLI